MKKNKRKLFLPIKYIAAAAIISLALIFIIGYIWRHARLSDYFKVTDIVTKDGSTKELSFLKERNIFNIDLKKESNSLLDAYPQCSKINLVRVLPNRIFINFVKRNPIAIVKLYKNFNLDREGVLFYALNDPQDSNLPVILGLETKIFGPKPGRRYTKEALPALKIIREFQRHKVLRSCRIRRIDLSSPANTSIFIDLSKKETAPLIAVEGFEVKLGEEALIDKISMLAGLISTVRNDIFNIKYIDLRFKEPVIKMKELK